MRFAPSTSGGSQTRRWLGALLLTGGVCGCAGWISILLADLIRGGRDAWDTAAGTGVLTVSLVTLITGFVLVADWGDPFADDKSLPEVRTFPEDDRLREEMDSRPTRT
jgi:hypothetical protein